MPSYHVEPGDNNYITARSQRELLGMVDPHTISWQEVSSEMSILTMAKGEERCPWACHNRWVHVLKPGLFKFKWTIIEFERLKKAVIKWRVSWCRGGSSESKALGALVS